MADPISNPKASFVGGWADDLIGKVNAAISENAKTNASVARRLEINDGAFDSSLARTTYTVPDTRDAATRAMDSYINGAQETNRYIATETARQTVLASELAGEATDTYGLYNETFDSLQDCDAAVEENPLSGYISPSYQIHLSLVSAPPGSRTSYNELLKAKKITFASTGNIETEIDDTFVISSTTMRTLTSVTAANPELSFALECKMEIDEPHGGNLDYRIREAAGRLGFSNENPAFYIWRMDITFNGYREDGRWVERVPIGGFRLSEQCDRITHFFHLITMEASIKSWGTKYSLSLAPVNIAAAMREEILASSSIEIILDTRDGPQDLNQFFTKLELALNASSAQKGTNHTFVFDAPKAILKEVITPGDTFQEDEGKITISLASGGSILTLVSTAIKSVDSLRAIGSESGASLRPPGAPNLSFTVEPEADYSSASFDDEKNTYVGITFTYRIRPYFEFKSLRATEGSDATSRLSFANKAIRRVYDYAWTSTNTEVLTFNTKLKMFYYINEGTGGQVGTEYSTTNASQNSIAQASGQSKETWFQRISRRAVNGDTDVPSGSPLKGDPTVTSGFGNRNVKGGSKYHLGNDLRAKIGTPVYATADGVVNAAGTGSGKAGQRIRITHGGGYETRYLHLSGFAGGIKAGTPVKKGDLIGYTGTAGTGPHLHYEIWENGRAIDPRDTLDGSIVHSSDDGHGHAPVKHTPAAPQVKANDEETERGVATGRIGRSLVVNAPNNIVGGDKNKPNDDSREQYELQFERKIGPDLVKLEGMEVRGDPRWLISTLQEPGSKYARVSSLIRVNINVPEQAEFMSVSTRPRKSDLNLGGIYELISIEHKLESGKFTQILTGFRPLGLNGDTPFSYTAPKSVDLNAAAADLNSTVNEFIGNAGPPATGMNGINAALSAYDGKYGGK